MEVYLTGRAKFSFIIFGNSSCGSDTANSMRSFLGSRCFLECFFLKLVLQKIPGFLSVLHLSSVHKAALP